MSFRMKRMYWTAAAALCAAAAPALAQRVAPAGPQGPAAGGAQGPAAGGYRLPPAPIPQILDTPPTPAVMVAPDGRTLVLLGRPGMPGIEELAIPELRLAGVRIDPRTNGAVRAGQVRSITLQDIASGEQREVRLPERARIGYMEWSPDGTRLAFANTTDAGIELWVADVRTARARRVLGPVLNAILGAPFHWAPDGRALFAKTVLPGRGAPPEAPRAPAAPIILESTGRAAPSHTFAHLLAGPHDEQLFEHYFTARLVRVGADGGRATPIGEPGILAEFSIAPGGDWILLTRVTRPYSYLAPVSAFGRETVILDARGRQVHTVEDRDEIVTAPIGRGAAPRGPRAVQWRADAPATLAWVEAVDTGNVRDRVLMLDAPFDGAPRTLIQLEQRYSGLEWGRTDLAFVHAYDAHAGRTRTWLVDPSRPDAPPRLLEDRSADDRYADPGRPVTHAGAAAEHAVLHLAPDGSAIYLTGNGASPRGDHPFLDRLDLATGRKERLWQAADPWYEYVVALLDDDARRIITRRESAIEPPNYFVRDVATGEIRALTAFPDPAPQLAGIQRQAITYTRDDGVRLSAALYTPAGYRPDRDGPLPMLFWAYPRSYRDAAAASQVSGSANRFSRPGGLSPLFLLTQGYAVLDGPAMPIVARNGAEPNDSYIEQLVASARAAVDRVVEMGVADRNRIAIAGHSYGAFMTANLLAHSDLFAAGIALSGAYNRTLTPFGFQEEPRSFWQARDVYRRMSPFDHADRIQRPILLVHGDADSNSGTFPLQSERFFHALEGLGATARYVRLPYEGHSYTARESVLHVLAEIVDWLDRYVR